MDKETKDNLREIIGIPVPISDPVQYIRGKNDIT
tara:strand:- start:428 stop:529 length:102 start_codon:yes stop_codon:yes gene_type:complete